MFYIKKKLEISASHQIFTENKAKCENLHGHNFIIYIFCKNKKLNENGMVIDFIKIEELIYQKIDHKNLNDVFSFNPTSENIAKWVADTVPFCYKVIVQESEDNEAIYEKTE